MAEKHGTPEEFEAAVWRSYCELMITHGEAVSAIQNTATNIGMPQMRKYQLHFQSIANPREAVFVAEGHFQTSEELQEWLRRFREVPMPDGYYWMVCDESAGCFQVGKTVDSSIGWGREKDADILSALKSARDKMLEEHNV